MVEQAKINFVELFGDDIDVGIKAIENVLNDEELSQRLLELETLDNDTFGLEVVGDLQSLLAALKANTVPKVIGEFYQRQLPIELVRDLNAKLKEAQKLVKKERKNPPVKAKPAEKPSKEPEETGDPSEDSTD